MNTLLAWIDLQPHAGPLGAAQGPDLTRYFLVLGTLLVAILALAFGFKKLFAGAMRAKAAKRHLAIVDLLPLGGKQRLAVVRCYDRTFALGLGDKEVSLIAELDPVHAEGRGQEPPGTAERAEFARVLRGALANGDERSAARAAEPRPIQDAASAAPAAPRSTSATAATVGKRVRELLGASGILG